MPQGLTGRLIGSRGRRRLGRMRRLSLGAGSRIRRPGLHTGLLGVYGGHSPVAYEEFNMIKNGFFAIRGTVRLMKSPEKSMSPVSQSLPGKAKEKFHALTGLRAMAAYLVYFH